MKRVWVVILIGIMLFVSICFIEFNICRLVYRKNKSDSEEILRIAYALISSENNNGNIASSLHSRYTSKMAQKSKIVKSVNDENEDDIVRNEEVLDSKEDIICGENIIGILVIPKLQVEAPIKEGTSQEVMKTSVGHFTESDYWNGNVSFASHDSGISAHYFEKINGLSINDEIEYITKLGTRKYKVQSIKQIESTDWSMVIKSDDQSENYKNTITLITCIKGKSNYRLCVRGVEI